MALVLLAERWDLSEVAVAAELHQGLHVVKRAPHIVADAQRRTGSGEGNGEDGLEAGDGVIALLTGHGFHVGPILQDEK